MRPTCPQDVHTADPVAIRVTLTERIDPAAADALWRIVLSASPESPNADEGDGDG